MHYVLVVLFSVAAYAARLENTYLPPSSAQSAGGNFLQAPVIAARGNFVGQSTHAPVSNRYIPPSSFPSRSSVNPFYPSPSVTSTRAGAFSPAGVSGYSPAGGAYSSPAARQVAILRFDNQNNGDGAYAYNFETENHIQQQESGQLGHSGAEPAVVAQGSYSYTSPEGATFTVHYTADENGFQPSGDHLPTPPPIPTEILQSLQKNAAEEARGIVDDGQYRPSPVQNYGAPPLVHQGGSVAGSINRQYLAPVSRSYPGQGGYRY